MDTKAHSKWCVVFKRVKNTFFTSIFGKAWPLWIGAVALAFANIFMFAYARAIGVFPQMSMWGSQLYNLIGIKVDAPFTAYPLTPLHLDSHSMINFGILFGAGISALFAREFKVRTESFSGYLAAVIGGMLMGIGTVTMPPCNVGGFYSATMALSLSGPVAAVGLLLGAYVGGLILKRQAKESAEAVDFDSAPAGKPVSRFTASGQPVIGVVIAVILAMVAFLYTSKDMPKFAGLLLFGAAFGVIFQRSRLCFTSAFREILISRNGTLMKWVLLSIAIGTVGFAVLKSQGYMQAAFVLPVGWHTIIGGFIFGIGMTLAGGCGIGILWRSAEGYVRAWLAIIAGMMTAALWVPLYGGHVGEGWLYGKPVSLGEKFGWFKGTVLVLLFLTAFYIFITYLEASKNEKD